MTPEEIRKLLGGYATGTLTPEEQQALFEAALDDQALFDLLAKEQPLRDLLQDPTARAQVLAATESRRREWFPFGRQWALIGAAAAAVLAVAAGVYLMRPKPAPRAVLTAELKPAPPVPSALSQPAPQQPSLSEKTPMRAKPPMRRAARAAMPRQTTGDIALDKPAAAPAPLAAPAAPPSAPQPLAPAQASANAAAQAAEKEQKALTGALGGALPTVAPTNARSLFYGAQFTSQDGAPQPQFQVSMGANSRSIGSTGAPNLGVKWTALRKGPDGLFNDVDAGQLKAGDVVKLRLAPNDNGYLSVSEAKTQILAERRVDRLQPVETPEITSEGGVKDLVVIFSRQPFAESLQQQAAGLIRAASAPQMSETDRKEHSVYQVQTVRDVTTPVLVRIRLLFR